MIAEVLRGAGYRCDTAENGREAQELIAVCHGSYDAVICDLRMPDMDGPTLFGWMKVHHPKLCRRILFVTGDSLGPNAGRFLARSRRPVLEKPFAPADLARLVSGFAPRRRSAP